MAGPSEEWLMSVFPNWKPGMLDGNLPAGKGHELLSGGYSDRWETKWGGGESVNGQIQNASFHLNHKVSINIIGNQLQIHDIRHDGKTDIWVYANTPSWDMRWSIHPSHYHELEPERIEKYLNTEIPNCKFWDMVQTRAKELYEEGNAN